MEEVYSKFENREFYIGEKIVFKMFIFNRIDKLGIFIELDYIEMVWFVNLKLVIKEGEILFVYVVFY